MAFTTCKSSWKKNRRASGRSPSAARQGGGDGRSTDDFFSTPSVSRGENKKSAIAGVDRVTSGLDWFRWSGPAERLHQVRRLFASVCGLDDSVWVAQSGIWFYLDRWAHPCGANICFTLESGGRNSGHCAAELSAKAIEHVGDDAALLLNKRLYELGFHATRIDPRICFEGSGIGLVGQMAAAAHRREHCRLRRFRPFEEYDGPKVLGRGVYLGSREGAKYFRAYDKGLEQGGPTQGEWVRLEVEFKDDVAAQFGLELAQLPESDGDFELGERFEGWRQLAAGAVVGAIDFRVRNGSTALARRPRLEFWQAVVDAAGAIKTYTSKRTQSDCDKHSAWLRRCVFPALNSLVKLTGWDQVQLWEYLAGDVGAYADAISRPVIWQYIQRLKGEDESPPAPEEAFAEALG